MKKILIYNIGINLTNNNLILLLFLFLFSFTPLFSQSSFVYERNNKSEVSETTLKPNNKIDGTKIDKFNRLNTEKKVEEDTTVTNKISSIVFVKNELKIKVQLIEKNKNISIKVYNLLGIEVLKIYEGTHSNDEYDYIVQWNLPDGIFICVLQGSNFRDAKKVIISRN
jgi:hypothetical protein